MKIAIEGCAHGALDKIYDVIAFVEEKNNIKIDLLLICGDFQAVRNETDLQCMAVPMKYRRMESFYKYYSGEKVAPILTIFIGGNHEASNYLTELNYGGWVCPNIYYLGKAGVIQVGGLRIAGLSGIYNGSSYLKGAYEIPPYDHSSLRTVYHVRNLEVFRLGLLKEPVDIMMSHDWPRGIYYHGDRAELIKKKPFFKEEIYKRSLGSSAAEKLLKILKPKYWFSAHLHCKFAAIVPHEDGRLTRFLALDKCLPNRKFLQITDIETQTNGPYQICHDLEWLAILRETNSLLNFTSCITVTPDPSVYDDFFKEISAKRREVYKLLKSRDGSGDQETAEEEIATKPVPISTDFEVTVPPYPGFKSQRRDIIPEPELLQNKQTKWLCRTLGLTDPVETLLQLAEERSGSRISISALCGEGFSYSEGSSKNPDEIDLQSDEEMDEIGDTNKTNETGDVDSDDAVDGPQDGEFKLFVIDRKPFSSTPYKRLSMSLPRPIHKELDDSNVSTTSADCTRNTFESSFETTRDTPGTTLDSVLETPDTTDSATKRMCSDSKNVLSVSSTAACDESVTPERKVIKRRNQAIYASKDSDESN